MAVTRPRARHDDAEPGARHAEPGGRPRTSGAGSPSSPSSARSAARWASRRSARCMAHRVTHYVQDGLTDLGPKAAAAGRRHRRWPDVDLTLPAPVATSSSTAYGHGVGDVFLVRRALRAARRLPHALPSGEAARAAERDPARGGDRRRTRLALGVAGGGREAVEAAERAPPCPASRSRGGSSGGPARTSGRGRRRCRGRAGRPSWKASVSAPRSGARRGKQTTRPAADATRSARCPSIQRATASPALADVVEDAGAGPRRGARARAPAIVSSRSEPASRTCSLAARSGSGSAGSRVVTQPMRRPGRP